MLTHNTPRTADGRTWSQLSWQEKHALILRDPTKAAALRAAHAEGSDIPATGVRLAQLSNQQRAWLYQNDRRRFDGMLAAHRVCP